MATSTARPANEVGAEGVSFTGDDLVVSLTDGRVVHVPLDRVPWLGWLRTATPEQRSQWSIEPAGFAIYWDDLDDGIEVRHLLALAPLA